MILLSIIIILLILLNEFVGYIIAKSTRRYYSRIRNDIKEYINKAIIPFLLLCSDELDFVNTIFADNDSYLFSIVYGSQFCCTEKNIYLSLGDKLPFEELELEYLINCINRIFNKIERYDDTEPGFNLTKYKYIVEKLYKFKKIISYFKNKDYLKFIRIMMYYEKGIYNEY